MAESLYAINSHAVFLGTQNPKHGGFQLHTVVPEIVVSPIPDSLTYCQGAVLPLAISTVAAGLYQPTHLGLPPPTETSSTKTGKTILIWGGSSSVGATAIQFACASGLTVATTASSRNHSFVKSLGATHVFDYSKDDVVDAIVSALKGTEVVGVYDAIATEPTIKVCGEILSQLGGGKLITVLPPPEKGLPENVQAIFHYATSVAMEHKQVGDAVWRKYVPDALAEGRLLAKPDPIIIKGGLAKVQEGMDKQKAGVSAGKIVIDLD